MDNASQTDTADNRGAQICAKVWSIICVPITALIFVGLALVFALIFTGYGIKRSGVFRDTFVKNDQRDCTPSPSQEQNFEKEHVKLSSIKKYPFVGSLISVNPYLFLCTVAVITRWYLLTTASCFTTNFSSLKVRLGSDYWDKKGTIYSVETFILHEEFNQNTQENNIALIKVAAPITMGDGVERIEITSTNLVKAGVGNVLGWNYWIEAEPNHVKLVEQELVIWKRASCRKYLGNGASFKLICASLNSSLCNLGVIGPLIANDELVGFWSWGLSCLGVPSIFNNVRHFKSWISEKVERH